MTVTVLYFQRQWIWRQLKITDNGA